MEKCKCVSLFLGLTLLIGPVSMAQPSSELDTLAVYRTFGEQLVHALRTQDNDWLQVHFDVKAYAQHQTTLLSFEVEQRWKDAHVSGVSTSSVAVETLVLFAQNIRRQGQSVGMVGLRTRERGIHVLLRMQTSGRVDYCEALVHRGATDSLRVKDWYIYQLGAYYSEVLFHQMNNEKMFGIVSKKQPDGYGEAFRLAFMALEGVLSQDYQKAVTHLTKIDSAYHCRPFVLSVQMLAVVIGRSPESYVAAFESLPPCANTIPTINQSLLNYFLADGNRPAARQAASILKSFFGGDPVLEELLR